MKLNGLKEEHYFNEISPKDTNKSHILVSFIWFIVPMEISDYLKKHIQPNFNPFPNGVIFTPIRLKCT